jgi:hypothetical protein
MTCKRSVVCCSLTSNNISHDGYSQTSRRSGRPMLPYLPKELIEIYSTPTPKGWHKPKSKGTCLVDQWELSITIAGVQYLYSRLDYESWSNKTNHKTWKNKQNFLIQDNLDSNLSLLRSPMRLLASCHADSADRAHSLEMMTPSY